MKCDKIKIITIIACISILSLLYFVLPVYNTVTVADGGQVMEFRTRAATVGELLADKGVVIKERDKIEPQPATVLAPNMTVRITRARAVELIADGETTTVQTSAARVSEVLREAGIVLSGDDRVIPDSEDTYSETIQVVRVEKKTVREEKSLAYDVQKVTDGDLLNGEQRIRQKGKSGLEEFVYEVVVEDGKEAARQLVERILVRKPVSEIVAVGSKKIVARGGQPLNFKEAKTMVATGYTHTGNQTYTDIWPTLGIVAVDPKVIPLRTRLYIDGYGYATAMDTGGAIKGNRIDLFFETRKEALKWGRRTVQVFILE